MKLKATHCRPGLGDAIAVNGPWMFGLHARGGLASRVHSEHVSTCPLAQAKLLQQQAFGV
jgi:hypothetical protein